MMKENETVSTFEKERERNKLSPFAIPGLKRTGLPPTIKKTTAESIVDATCEYFSLNKKELVAKGRKTKFVYPRQCAIFLMTQYTALKLHEIAECISFPVFDHSTIIHSRDVIRKRLYVRDGDVNEDIGAIYDLATKVENH